MAAACSMALGPPSKTPQSWLPPCLQHPYAVSGHSAGCPARQYKDARPHSLVLKDPLNCAVALQAVDCLQKSTAKTVQIIAIYTVGTTTGSGKLLVAITEQESILS